MFLCRSQKVDNLFLNKFTYRAMRGSLKEAVVRGCTAQCRTVTACCDQCIVSSDCQVCLHFWPDCEAGLHSRACARTRTVSLAILTAEVRCALLSRRAPRRWAKHTRVKAPTRFNSCHRDSAYGWCIEHPQPSICSPTAAVRPTSMLAHSVGHIQAVPATARVLAPTHSTHAARRPSRNSRSAVRTAATDVPEALEQPNTQLNLQTPAMQPTAPRPSYVRRCRAVDALVGMLHKHHNTVTPQFWVTALCHLSELVADNEQQITPARWSQLQRSLLYLADPQAAVAHKKQQRWKQIQQRIQQYKDAGTWVEKLQPQQPPQHTHYAQPQLTDQQQEAQPQHQQQRLATLQLFSASDLATLIWALAKLHPHLTPQQQVQLTGKQQQAMSQLYSEQQGTSLADTLWPPLLQLVAANSSQLTPRDVAVVAWGVQQLQLTTTAGWLSDLLESQAAVLHTYPTRTLAVLLYSCARRPVQLPATSLVPMLNKIMQDLSNIQHKDLSMILWSLGALKAQPGPAFMTAVLSASKRHISSADWPEIVAILVGTARLGVCPDGRWLLELYDQLYWTVDQLELRQLVSVIWALGRFRVAVPQELLERLVAFARLQLKQDLERLMQQQQQQQALLQEQHGQQQEVQDQQQRSRQHAGQQQQHIRRDQQQQAPRIQPQRQQEQQRVQVQQQPGLRQQQQQEEAQEDFDDMQDIFSAAMTVDSTLNVTSISTSTACGTSSIAAQQYTTAKLLYMLLQGLARLKVTLSPKLKREIADCWLPVVFFSQGPLTHVHVPAVLHACVVLRIRVSPELQPLVFSKLAQLQQDMNLHGLALGLKAVIRLGFCPDQQWLQEWLAFSKQRLGLAQASEVVMLLRSCAVLKHQPPDSWLNAVLVRLQELLLVSRQMLYADGTPARQHPGAYGGISAAQLAAAVEHLVALGVSEVPAELLQLMCEVVDMVESQGAAPAAVQRFQACVQQLTSGG